MSKKLLIIGSVWPEPNSSAAGSRMMQLIDFFLEEKYKITFASATVDSAYRYPIEKLGVAIEHIAINNKEFDTYIEKLNPAIVLFDRFMTEEQFGWRVEKNSPNSLRILDTEDLHCLRKGRQKAVKENREFVNEDLRSDIAKREIASIYRCDVTLMISKFEIELLLTYFKIPENIICYLPFMVAKISEEEINSLPSFEHRKHFVTIGSFRHEPNWDSVLFLKNEIWPVLRKNLPKAELHVYGSYPPEKAMQLHKPSENFYIKGWAKNAHEVIKNAKVMLAPLRFGAGLKGKFFDGMLNGTPSVTTSIGAEGMHDSLNWSGFIENNVEKIILAAEKLYTHNIGWEVAQKKGFEIISSCFSKEKFSKNLRTQITHIQENLEEHRNANFIGSMLLFHTMRSTEFMSRWIEEKNK